MAGTELTIPAAGVLRACKERVVRLEIRTAVIAVILPQQEHKPVPVSLFAVLACEAGTGDDDEALHQLAADRRASG